MFRGFRWQLVALLIALTACAAAAVFRISRQSRPPAIAPTEAPRIVDSNPSESPTPTITPPTAPESPPVPARDAMAAPAVTTLREGLIGSVQRINPLFAHLNSPDQDLASLIYEGLFAINDYGEVVPRLAADLVISSDGLEYVVKLRDDVKWHNGVAFSADDVVFTFALLGSAAYADFSDSAAFWRTVEVQKLSAGLLRFRLVQPFSSFPLLLTVGILPEHVLRGSSVLDLASHPFNLAPIGAGPYQLAALHAEDKDGIDTVHLQRSPTHQERPEAQVGYLFRDMVFRLYDSPADAISAYESGEIDALAMAAAPQQLLALPQSQHFRQALSQLSVLIFNWNDRPFKERRLRQALALSLDLPRLAQAHNGAVAVFADSPYILGSSVYQPQDFWRAYDLERANTLLAASELRSATPSADDSDDEDAAVDAPSYKLLVSGSARLPGLAEEIAAQWRLLGIDFSVESTDALSYRNRLETGDFDAAIVTQRIGADRDLFRFWHPAQHGKGSNYGAASHNEIAELIEIARGEIYAGRRALLYQQLQEVFAEQALAIPLAYPLLTYIASDSIEGIKLGFLSSPADRFRGIQHWRPSTLAG